MCCKFLQKLICKKRKCTCRGQGICNGQTFANICPGCKIEDSFVEFPNFFQSTCIEDPSFYTINDVKYLAVTGRGVYIPDGHEGVFTLILIDSNKRDGYSFDFIASNNIFSAISVINFGSDLNVTVDDCSKCSIWNKSNQTHINDKLETVKDTYYASGGSLYARKFTFGVCGIREEDISCYICNKYYG